MIQKIKALGPGLIFAGASIGVSHLVMSTKAGALHGFGLIWALLLVHLFKYPFFQYGPRYATATGESLIEGYRKLGKGFLLTYFIISLLSMFTIQAAVTIVTAGLAINLFGITDNPINWSIALTVISVIILILGRYKLLDSLMKVVILILTITTISSVFIAGFSTDSSPNFVQFLPKEAAEIAFLIAFLGWMPSPLDLSVIHSLWAIEKKKETTEFNTKKSITDFNIGYFATIFLGICFVALGYFVMYGSGTNFSSNAGGFAQQLIQLYTNTIGDWAYYIIAIAAFSAMFSTTLTTLDATPRAMAKIFEYLFPNQFKKLYWIWVLLLAIGTIVILNYFMANMGQMVFIATVLSFLTAPFFAISNFILIKSKHTPKEHHPNKGLALLSYLGIVFLIGFSAWYLSNL